MSQTNGRPDTSGHTPGYSYATFTGSFAGTGATTTPAGPQQKPPRTRRGRRGVGVTGSLIGFLLFFCAMFFGLSWLVSPEPDVETAQPVAVAELNGRDVVLVAYSRDGPRGMFQLMFQPMFQSRLAAIDAETGDAVWDVRLDEELSSDMRVLAAGEDRVYIASDEGLYIRSLSDGGAVAEPDAIDGLGDSYVAELGSYDYDAARRLVVAIDQAGELWQIPVGDTTAVPADAETVAAWQEVLSDTFRFALDFPTTGEPAIVADGVTLSGRATKAGALTESLVLTASDGTSSALGDETFLEPEIVLDGTRGTGTATVVGDWSVDVDDYCAVMPEPCDLDSLPDEVRKAIEEAGQSGYETEADYAAGIDAGYVLVRSKADANGDAYRLSSVDLETGEVIDSVETGYEIGGGYSAGGITAVATSGVDSWGSDRLVVAAADGSLTVASVGASNFFGWPA
ncbi:MAG: PA2928 family protein [Solirubrobacterales bacterium]